MMAAMKPKSIEDLLERVRTWPPGAQGDLAQAALGIETDIEQGAYGDAYKATPEEIELLKQRMKDLDKGKVSPVGYEEVKAVFAKYRHR
jgi:hypothetical protein